jgi:hypothetical protein
MQPIRNVPPERRRPQPQQQPARRQRKRKRSRLGRAIVVLLLLVGLGGIAAIVAADELGGDPQLRRVTERNGQRAIEEVREFIQDNTR